MEAGSIGDSVGQSLRAARLSMGWKASKLAAVLGVSETTVSRWENGHVLPSKLAWRALQQLAAELGSPLEDGAPEDGG